MRAEVLDGEKIVDETLEDLKKGEQKITYAFIDASNLFYGGEKSLGWKIDYKK